MLSHESSGRPGRVRSRGYRRSHGRGDGIPLHRRTASARAGAGWRWSDARRSIAIAERSACSSTGWASEVTSNAAWAGACRVVSGWGAAAGSSGRRKHPSAKAGPPWAPSAPPRPSHLVPRVPVRLLCRVSQTGGRDRCRAKPSANHLAKRQGGAAGHLGVGPANACERGGTMSLAGNVGATSYRARRGRHLHTYTTDGPYRGLALGAA